ncbi:glutamate-1-semialdehyde 2,1-aminomutase [Arachidicoccus rhizosphaerae]|uniref:Glutamate-1-semialdehyde 2,1-aminomutase n=1 Tax=Arachidicoccus rhizosphaerae TaxID=551991 RepID=A0A1H3VJ92_9BACT|nr:glutamate-1-semialdehyde 2,1-aminomutase [Arachidicoccus rhizosphaerae]SDZ74836.1 glutamate-1-semialdehyde 2,1-aminomutase [Arachidicoccus rhizosphaerae]
MYEYTSSKRLFERAQSSIPGGVNSPVRAFKSVGGTPIFIEKAKGAYLFDVDGQKYIDFIASWGPMILGHSYEPVIRAIQQKAENSTSFGAPTELEVQMAELIKELTPNVDLIRMVNSGTEACMSALRVARGYTGRNKFIKFEGCYHGHADMFLVKAGSGVATFGIQEVPGVTAGTAQDTLTAPYNDLEAVRTLVQTHKDQIAAIIVEPVAGNMGCVLPAAGFLAGLREICDQEKIVLIFDEVMTGFRLAPGGAQQKLAIDADLVTYGKVIGAGLPVGAFGGKKELMERVAPLGDIYQAGTLSGNPLAMIAGYTLLTELKNHPEYYQQLEQKGAYLKDHLTALFKEADIPAQINQFGSMLSIFFNAEPVTDFLSASKSDMARFTRLFHGLLKRGVHLPPSGYESWFLSNALSQSDLDQTLEKVKQTLQEL